MYGRKKWKACLARDLGVDVSTIHRIGKKDRVPSVYEIAIAGMIHNWEARQELEKQAKKLGIGRKK